MQELQGEILGEGRLPCGGLGFLAHLADGGEVVAAVPKGVAREMFRIVPGDRVHVTGMDAGMPGVLGFAR